MSALRLRSLASTIVIAVACGGEGPQGPAGQDTLGPPGEAGESGATELVLSAVTPSRLYLGREVVVSISGSGTRWSAEEPPEIDAGEAIEVLPGSIVVASPTALRATLRVGDDATVGLRDVAVCAPADGDDVRCALREDAAVAQEALAIQPAVEASYLNGFPLTDLPQGSITQARLVQLDPTTPFSLVSGDVAISVGPGSVARPTAYASDYELVFFLFADVKATTGSQAIVVESGPEGAVTRSVTAPGAVRVLERPPATLFPGVNDALLPYADASLLFEIKDPEQGTILTIEARADSPDALADITLLDGSGRFSDTRDVATKYGASSRVRAILPKPVGSLYLVYRGFGGGSNYPLELELSESDDASVRPLAAGGADGQIADPGQAEWFSFTPPSGAIKLSLAGAGGDTCGPAGGIDSELLVLRDDGTKIAANDDFGESHCSGVVFESEGGATYYVTVMSSRRKAPLGTFAYRLSQELL